ncbi:hypothetical protein DLNHIDIE_00171 [Acidithiobacillus thiooxidans ATCC 19377]|jgi:hypothetical protein|uniref:Uncharacterized protein n=1 Tax=Acidithiobacillus thiooxidans ATCC 19377 TaxID=637390 RepID=A0A543Q1Z7_ACITH|nr:hypothetical protein DLNHIDIE_00171 [Acidithiobacillus thiooxidans ATCC 19377]
MQHSGLVGLLPCKGFSPILVKTWGSNCCGMVLIRVALEGQGFFNERDDGNANQQ